MRIIFTFKVSYETLLAYDLAQSNLEGIQFIDIKAIHARSSQKINTAIAKMLEHEAIKLIKHEVIYLSWRKTS